MAYYETDGAVLAWFERALVHSAAHVRISAVCLLADVDCTERRRWLHRAQRDSVPEVVATAALIEAVVDGTGDDTIDLFESDFGEQLERGDLGWEWEYEVVIAHDVVVQAGARRAWTACEDDGFARQLALQKAYCGKEAEIPAAVALIVGKRLVNHYTRSPRSMAEAAWWMRTGRPRYRE